MKNIIQIKNILGAIVILLVFSSCDDFLNSPPADRLSSEGFYNTPAQCEQAIIGIYVGLRNLSDTEFLLMSEVRSDNSWVASQTNALRQYSEIGTFRAGNDLATFSSTWDRWFNVIYNTNLAITKIPDCDFGSREAFKNQLLGEAHFIRGWAYFEMVRLFGNIPLIDKPASPSEVENTGQSTPREIYDRIVVPDLLEAKAKLPLSQNMVNANGSSIKGRADRVASQAMLGRVYMTMAGFPLNDASAKSLAETELKAVIDFSVANSDKYWAPDSVEWQKQWMPSASYYNKYSIFAIQYREGGTGNPAVYNFCMGLPPSYTSRNLFGSSSGGLWVEMSLAYEFERIYPGTNRQDARGINHSMLAGYDAEPNWPAYTRETRMYKLPDGSDVEVYITNMFYKYLPSKRKLEALGFSPEYENSMRNDTDWGVNYPVIRLEDIMLMYAEILVEKNDITGAMAIVNKIRTRAGCDPETATTSAEAMTFLKRERRVELMGEGIRWFDLIRWNEWKSALEQMFDRYNDPFTDKANIRDGRYLYPIPMTQMDVKPGLYWQNEGY